VALRPLGVSAEITHPQEVTGDSLRCVPYDEATAKRLTGRVRQDHAEWLQQGVDISCWGVNPKTGVLEIGIRSSVAEAEPRLRARYGDDISVHYANVVPAAGPLRE
jgi:hypothetical protein